ncbi:MAG: hypothetical protein FWD61_06510 [Phycisphaerales bacterium]|nr:hypothetical protein [Phycisphaerales bacterium]
MRKVVLVVVSFFVIAAGFAAAAVDVLPNQISENRNIAFARNSDYRSLSVTLELRGPETLTAVRYGDIQLDEAVDDKGTDLLPPERKEGSVNNWATTFQWFVNDYDRKEAQKQNRPIPDPQVCVRLVGTPRAATKIARLRGSLTITDPGTLQTAELTDLKPGDKKKMDFPENVGIALTVNVKDGSDVKDITIAIAGPEDLIDTLEVQDSEGKAVSYNEGGSYQNKPNSPILRRLRLNKPLDASMKLVAKVSVDRTLTKIPFDLKDIDLP